MEKQFTPGDRVMIKSEGECLKGSVLQVTEKDITVQLEDVSHTVVIEKYNLDTLHLCDDDAR